MQEVNISYFNPRTPSGVRQLYKKMEKAFSKFQSTHPKQGATYSPRLLKVHTLISIHAPQAGCDIHLSSGGCNQKDFNPRTPPAGCDQEEGCSTTRTTYFNPRTPSGVRLARSASDISAGIFQSTHPKRGATAKIVKFITKFHHF